MQNQNRKMSGSNEQSTERQLKRREDPEIFRVAAIAEHNKEKATSGEEKVLAPLT
jgi:hypothetical protein